MYGLNSFYKNSQKKKNSHTLSFGFIRVNPLRIWCGVKPNYPKPFIAISDKNMTFFIPGYFRPKVKSKLATATTIKKTLFQTKIVKTSVRPVHFSPKLLCNTHSLYMGATRALFGPVQSVTVPSLSASVV